MLTSLAILALATPSQAGWHVDAALATDAPVDIGARATVEGPLRLRFSSGVGWMPPAYVATINATVVALGGYNEATANLVDAALRNSLVLRNHVGWRPFPNAGFQFEVGHGLVMLGGGLSGVDAIAAALGEPPPETESDRTFLVHATLHMVDVTAGWEFTLPAKLVLRIDLGGAFTIDSRTRIERDFTVVSPVVGAALDALQEEGATYLDEVLEGWAHTPTASVALAWRFQ